MEKYCTAREATDGNMARIACWITEATNTYSEYVILTVFPVRQWLHERASMLRYITLPILRVFQFLSLSILILTLFFSLRLSSLAFLMLQSLNPS